MQLNPIGAEHSQSVALFSTISWKIQFQLWGDEKLSNLSFITVRLHRQLNGSDMVLCVLLEANKCFVNKKKKKIGASHIFLRVVRNDIKICLKKKKIPSLEMTGALFTTTMPSRSRHFSIKTNQRGENGARGFSNSQPQLGKELWLWVPVWAADESYIFLMPWIWLYITLCLPQRSQ